MAGAYFGGHSDGVERERKTFRNFFRYLADGCAFLHCTGEIEAAENRLVLVGIFLKQRGNKRAQRRLDGRKLIRKSQQPRRHRMAAVGGHIGHAHFAQAFVQFFKTLVETCDGVGFAVGVIGQCGAPYALAFELVGVGKKIDEARDQIHLGKQDVDRGVNFQIVGELLHALAQIFSQIDHVFRLVLR